MVTASHGTNVNTFYMAPAVKIVGIPVLQELLHIRLGRRIIPIAELLVIANKVEIASVSIKRRVRICNRITQ